MLNRLELITCRTGSPRFKSSTSSPIEVWSRQKQSLGMRSIVEMPENLLEPVSVGQLKTVAISPVSFQAPPSNQQERLLIIESETEGLV